ncbi:ABC transporter substrate-binding protein [Reyranella soli]|uniref:ABC transporter substrate-binding protein n=1 Tax=Reyranella soli TaxID=1230389 RepID=A0A512N5M4_9HYPH|nr:ABC transporter substrate-binding protein [Reyranella soli]GEP54297.1 ABC transporter substrate-binding protein [Reyranella soli]
MKTGINRRLLLQTMTIAGGISVSRSLFPAPALAKDLKGTGTVAVYDGGGSWGEAKRIAYFEPFEKETGIKVVIVPRTDTGAVRASILAGAPRYDVTILSGSTTATFAREDMLLPIDYSYFETADLDGFDPVKPGKFSVPHIIYSLVLAYDGAKFAAGGPASWADIWDVKKFPGPRSLPTGTWGGDGGTFECALMADGVEPANLYPLDWDRAFKSLDRIKPNILKWWASGAEGPQLIVDKQIAAGSAWNGRVSAANEQGAKIGFSWNQGILQYDNWVLPKGAKNTVNAQKFIAFASRPENQAKFAERILYAPPNAKAYDFLKPERAKLLPTQPEARKLQFVQDYEFWNATRPDKMPNNKYAVAEWEKWIAGAR